MSSARRWPVILLGSVLVATSSDAAPPLWATAVLPSGSEHALEVAADPVARQRGYMFRESVAPDEGMLFVFEGSGRHAMWMKNCRVALDIVWLDEAFRVKHVERDLRPCPESGACPTIAPPVDARFVLELAAGTAARENLRVGDTIVVLADRPLR